MVWARNTELLEKNIAHIGIKVLPGMHDNFLQATCFSNDLGDYAGFDELWAGTNDGEEFFHIQ